MRRGEKIKVKVYEIKVYENRAATDFLVDTFEIDDTTGPCGAESFEAFG
jgi:hypothetical protein